RPRLRRGHDRDDGPDGRRPALTRGPRGALSLSGPGPPVLRDVPLDAAAPAGRPRRGEAPRAAPRADPLPVPGAPRTPARPRGSRLAPADDPDGDAGGLGGGGALAPPRRSRTLRAARPGVPGGDVGARSVCRAARDAR